MNVLASRVALRYASLRRAGLFDRDLVMKAVQYVLRGVKANGEVEAFEFDLDTEDKTETDNHDYPHSEGTYYLDVTVPVGTMARMDFALPTKLMAQVPVGQREEFMLEVLKLVAFKLKPAAFLKGFYGGDEGLQVLLQDNNPMGMGFEIKGFKPNARMTTPEQAGRSWVRGNEMRLPVKFKATYEVDWKFGYVEDDILLGGGGGYAERDDYYDDSDYGPHGYSPD